MYSETQGRRRKFYGWGYEGDDVSPQEIAEFEKAWTRLIGASDFAAVPFPTEGSINLRPSRVKVPASLEAICTTDKYDRLYHTYGASTVDVAYSVRGEIKNPRSKLRGIGGRKEADQKNAASCGEYVPKEIQESPRRRRLSTH
jgi:alkyldihydroxyacetonephosphate synthase